MRKVAIIGVGVEGFRPAIRDLSYKEMVYRAAVKAYTNADIDPRKEVDTFISCEEDFSMGTSITDEYAPDQLGGAQRSVQTITGDGIQGMAAAYMQIATGMFDVAVVEAQSRISDMLTPNQIQHFALDPIFVRQFNSTHHSIAALEKQAYQHAFGVSDEIIAEVAVKNYRNAILNPIAAYGMNASKEDILETEIISAPLREGEVAEHADGAIVVVMASEDIIKQKNVTPVWVKGISYATNTPNVETRDWKTATYAKLCADRAYKMAGITDPKSQIDLFEIDDTYAFKELQHLEALGIFSFGEAAKALADGKLERGGDLPVNVSGGVLGVGNGHDVNGLQRVAEIVDQLTGEAGKRTVSGAKTGLAFSWRGVPTTAGALAILSVE